MKPLVIIPARGGSKGLPGKNIKPLKGKPLIHYTIEAARAVFSDERICVSTDDLEIKQCAELTGLQVPFLRPDELASDTAGSREVILHAIDYYDALQLDFDTIILLQPTSPLRTAQHLEQAVAFYESGIELLVSVKLTDANPYYVLKEENADGFLEPSKQGAFVRRQDCPEVYELNGAIYIINKAALQSKTFADFTRIKKFVMDKRSSIDIDDIIDFQLAELIISEQ